MTFTVESGSDLLVRMEHISKHYLAGDLTVDVLRDINIQIPSGEFVVAQRSQREKGPRFR